MTLSKSLERGPRASVIVCTALAAFAMHAQMSQTTASQNPAPSKNSKPPPAFSAAGAHGSTSPSGYSTGISIEENSAVSQGVNALGRELLSGYIPNGFPQSCSLEPELVKAVLANPQAYDANHSLGLFYLKHGEFSRSLPYLESARRLRPADQENLHALVLALLGVKKNQEAIDLLQATLPTLGKDAVLFRLLALTYQLAGDEGQARENYQHSLAASPNDANNQLAAGLGLIGIGASLQATEIFNSATADHPGDAKLWLGLGIGQYEIGRKPEAIRSLLQAIAIDRDLVPAYSFLGALADASPESATAIRTRLAEFVVTHPSSAGAHYDYALALWLQSRNGFFDPSNVEIESQLKLALTADPDMGKAHHLLGVVYGDMGDLRRAESEFSEAIRLEPDNIDAHYHLAQVYKRDHKAQLGAAEMSRFESMRGSGNLDEPIAKLKPRDAGGDPLNQLAMASPCNRQP